VRVDRVVVAVTRRRVVLSLRAAGLGDLLTAIPALRAISRAHPRHVHVVAAPEPLWPLLDIASTADALIPTSHLRAAHALAHGVDVAVNLHGSGPESHRLLLASQPRTLIAFRHPDVPRASCGPEWNEHDHEVTRWCRLLGAYGIDADPADLDIDVPPGPLPPRVAGATIIHPGAASPARRWPITRWAAVARAERAEGRAVAVTAGPRERALAEAVADLSGPGTDVVDCSDDMAMLCRVVAAADRIVCGDTGVAHLATAVRTPSVILCGPVAPSRWGPPPDRPWHVALWAGRAGDPHASRPDPGLLELGVADVVAALRGLPCSASRDRRATG